MHGGALALSRRSHQGNLRYLDWKLTRPRGPLTLVRLERIVPGMKRPWVALSVSVIALTVSACGEGSRAVSGSIPAQPLQTTVSVTESTPSSTIADVSPVDGPSVQTVTGPRQAFTASLPLGFIRRGNDDRPSGGGDTFPGDEVDSATYFDPLVRHHGVTISVEHGDRVNASERTKTVDPAAATLEALRPEGTVMSLTDPVSDDVSMWWAASPTSVVWVYGYGFSNAEMMSVVKSIEVGGT